MVQPQPKGQHQGVIPLFEQARASTEARHAILYLEGMLHDNLLKMVDLLEDLENPDDFAHLRKALLDIIAAVRATTPWSELGIAAREAASLLAAHIHLTARMSASA